LNNLLVKHLHNSGAYSLALAALFFAANLPGQARLGETIGAYKSAIAREFKFKSQSKKDARTDYMYSLVVDQKTQEAAPGFAGGLTVSAVGGRITGQSMVLRIGDSYEAGKTLVASHALKFAYEALGKPTPASTEKEFNAYSIAIDQVLAGAAQNLRYPGFSGAINITRYGDGMILITAKVDAQPPPGGPEPVKK
jgi:hypothetical protein